ncbi:MAG: S-layer homology domain-containing protein, partial [Mesotoga sp.]
MLLRNKFVLIATLLICALSFAGLKDIAASPYSAAIEKLFAAGIVEAENDLFNPTEVLSRADAAEWIVKTFKLSTIQSMKLEEEVEK